MKKLHALLLLTVLAAGFVLGLLVAGRYSVQAVPGKYGMLVIRLDRLTGTVRLAGIDELANSHLPSRLE